MHILSTLAKIYPYWAIALIVIFMEVGVFFRRKGSRLQFYFWAMGGGLGMGIILWLAFRGDIHSGQWVKSLLG